MSGSTYRIRVWEPGDEARLLELHNRAFSGAPPRSLEHWRWRFLDSPADTPEIVLAEDDEGRCVAVYAAISHPATLQGEPCRAGLQTDAAVAADKREGLGGGRHFVAAGRLFRERFVTPEVRIEWGFPEPALQRVCLRYLGVGVLRDVVFLVRESEGGPSLERTLDVAALQRFDAETDELWARVVPHVGAAVRRDARYLNWRYVDHPDVRHGIIGARDPRGGALRGVAVFREGGPDERLLSLMDWIVPFDDAAAEASLLAALRAEAVRRGKPYVAAWLPSPRSLFQRFQRSYGFFAQATPFQESYRSWKRGVGRRWLAENWYQTMGDIDFF